MRTNIVLDEKLVDQGLALTRCASKRELVDLALRELVTRRRVKPLTELAGKIQFYEGYDHKDTRASRAVHDATD